MHAAAFERECRRFWRNSNIALVATFVAMFVYVVTVLPHYREIYESCNAFLGTDRSSLIAYAIIIGPVFAAFGVITLVARALRPGKLYCPSCGKFIGQRQFFDSLCATHACPKCGKAVLETSPSVREK